MAAAVRRKDKASLPSIDSCRWMLKSWIHQPTLSWVEPPWKLLSSIEMARVTKRAMAVSGKAFLEFSYIVTIEKSYYYFFL